MRDATVMRLQARADKIGDMYTVDRAHMWPGSREYAIRQGYRPNQCFAYAIHGKAGVIEPERCFRSGNALMTYLLRTCRLDSE